MSEAPADPDNDAIVYSAHQKSMLIREMTNLCALTKMEVSRREGCRVMQHDWLHLPHCGHNVIPSRSQLPSSAQRFAPFSCCMSGW